MSTTQPIASFPTPYGISVPVYRPAVIDQSDPDAFTFDLEGAAICAGIYTREDRERYKAAAKALGHAPPFEQFGGGKVPRVALPIPRDPAYPRVSTAISSPVESWVTGTMDRPFWHQRAPFLIDIIGDNLEQPGLNVPIAELVYPLALSTVMTAALEHLGETEIDCLEAAAIYALAEHEEWRRPAQDWLLPYRETWFREWRDSRPRYTAFARALRKIIDIPLWIAGAGDAA